uniref:RNA-directed DNA polymerase n=1 Tax=Anopheles atroparvus TaxID=41427 RepID=A0AAG5DQN0_ANOAO
MNDLTTSEAISALVADYTLPGLVKKCATRNLATTGKKEELAVRIVQYDEAQAQVQEQAHDKSLYEDAGESSVARPTWRREEVEAQENYSCSLRDIEGSLESYGGGTEEDVRVWFEQFEEMAEMARWSPAQRYIMCRRKLVGTARNFLGTLRGVTRYGELRERLFHEFGGSIKASDVHRKLAARERRRDETMLDYVYTMQKIASGIELDEASLIEYVVDGAVKEPKTRAFLYSANNIGELKAQLALMERAEQKRGKERNNPLPQRTTKEVKPEYRIGAKKGGEENRVRYDSRNDGCYNCGNTGHRAKECELKPRGPRCYECNMFGHVAKNCPKRNCGETNTIDARNVGTVQTAIDGVALYSLFDTGSQYNLITQNAHSRIGAPKVSGTTMCFNGFGAKQTAAKGKIQRRVKINGHQYGELAFFIVPNGSMKYDLLLGRESLQCFDVVITGRSLEFKPHDVPPREDGEVLLNEEYWVNEITVDSNELDIAPQYTTHVRQMIKEYTPRTDVKSEVETKIILYDETPVRSTPRRFAPREKAVLEATISEWLEKGIIKESESDFASPVTLARKKDGSFRVCVDYRELNRKMVKDCFPMRNIEDQIDQLKSARVFTTLDLKNSFFHVPVEKSSQRYTSFVTHAGQYEFLRTPFGLSNSPASFSRFVANVFLPTNDEETNLKTLKELLKIASESGIQFNWQKSEFLKSEVEYLGYTISNGTYRISPRKIRAVQYFPQPKNAKELQRFLGLTSYFRKFIAGYAMIAKPLTNLLRKGEVYEFGQTQQRSFGQLKECLTSDPVLKIYDEKGETELHTDASKCGYGAALVQKSDDNEFHPVKNYSAYHLEVLAVVRAVEKFRVYLLGIKFKIITDCSAFQHTLRANQMSARIARWALMLEEYEYEVVHRAGSSMRHVDALSRAPVMMITRDPMIEALRRSQNQDERVKAIAELLKTQKYENYVECDGLVMKVVQGRELIVVPSDLQKEIIKRAHDNGHLGARKLEDVIQREFYITNLSEKIKQVIECCVKCILAERKRGKTEGLLNPIIKGDVPLDTYHVDRVGPMDITEKKYKYVFVVVDAFTKYTWVYPTKTTNSCEVIQRLTAHSEVFGNPRRIVSDKGAAFTSNDFREYCADRNIEHIAVTTGVPRGNRQVERVIQVILSMLKKASVDDPAKWYKHVANIQRWINASPHQSIGMTPFEAMFGVPMKHEGDLRLSELMEEIKVAQYYDQREGVRASARASIAKAQGEQRKSYDLRARMAPAYQKGDLVSIKRTQFGPGRKYAADYLGPYKVIGVRPHDRYEVAKISGEGPKMTTTAASHMKPFRVGVKERKPNNKVNKATKKTDDRL